jgi:hypothetical protein
LILKGKINIVEIFLERQVRINHQSKNNTNGKKEKLQWANLNLSCNHIILEYVIHISSNMIKIPFGY